MKRLAFAILAPVCLSASALAADSTVVSGVVTTKDDGLPLPNATVTIAALNLTATTDQSGRYSLTVPADKSTGAAVEVKVTAPGLRTRTASVSPAGGTITVDFALTVGFHEEVIVGSRASGAEAAKAVPVDILTAKQIEGTGAAEVMQILQALAPSFNFPRPTISDGTDSVRPATLRGLGPDQVLVLINGKRRHQTALIHINSTIGRGSTGVDLNALPVSAIERIEILRDGAAAQYGSDAIAGVINIVLKSGVAPPALSLRGGFSKGSFTEVRGVERNFSDGGVFDASGTWGFQLGRGSGNLSVEYRDRNGTNRAGFDTGDQQRAGDALNNPVPQPNVHWGDSEEWNVLTFFNAAAPVNSGETTFFYAFGGWSRRDGVHGGNYRRAIDAGDWPQIYPLGFLPLIEPKNVDASATVGLRGERAKWFWDASAQYGHNRLDYDVTNSLNVSLGPTIPPNHAEFYAGAIAFDQLIANLDLTRQFDVGLAGPLNVAAGLEYRRETYKIFAGEPDSWRDGGSRNQFGQPAALGAQVFPGFRPTDETDANRNNFAVYGDIEGDVAKPLRIGVAGRYEHYSDFGNTVDGKLTLRIEPHKRFVIRGAASTGFRAPSLGQSFFRTTSTNFSLIGGVFVPLEVLTAPVGNPVARALGAEDLKPEESIHVSGGLVWNPVDPFEFSADYYHIDINDRVVLSGNFQGGRLTSLLQPFGVNSARYFTNAIDTTTKGVDLIANYRADLNKAGALRLQVAFNHTETRIDRVTPTPPVLAGFENTLFDGIEHRRFTCAQPEDNLRLTADWSSKKSWGALARLSRYGDYCSIEGTVGSPDITPPQVHGAEWVSDIDVSYRRDKFVIAVGVENLFNTLPDPMLPLFANRNQRTFPRNAPFGFNGRFLYGKVTFRF